MASIEKLVDKALEKELPEPKRRKLDLIQGELNQQCHKKYYREGKCTVITNGIECGEKLANRPFNVARHIERNHSELYAAVKKELDSGKLDAFMGRVETKGKPLRLFTLYAATSTFSAAHVDNPYLQRFCSLIPQFKLPSRRGLMRLMDEELNAVMAEAHKRVAENQLGLTVTCDIASTRRLKDSYLAICGWFNLAPVIPRQVRLN